MPRNIQDLSLSDDTTVLAILEDAAHRVQLADVYRHENGFVKIPIELTATSQLRVHVWDAVSRPSGGSLHSHRHAIRSRVVTGALIEERWLVDPTGTPYLRYDFSPGAPGTPELVERGKVQLSRSRRMARQPGDLYAIPVHEFHTLEPKTTPAITVVVQDLRQLAEASVASSQPLGALSRPRLMDGDQRKEIRAILLAEVASLGSVIGQHRRGERWPE